MPNNQVLMTPVKSSNLKAVGYDRIQGILHVQFNNGVTWMYDGVPTEEYEMLLLAPSIGKYYTKHIKGKYEGVRAEER